MRKLIITAMLAIVATVAETADIVKLRLSTMNGFAPLTVVVTMTVEPHEDNRKLCLAWDSPEGEAGGSCWDIDGNTPKTSSRQIRFGIGDYVIQATVVRVHEGKPSYHVAKTTLNVLEPGTPFVR